MRPPTLTRRALLAAPLLATACTGSADPAPPAPVDPDVALRAAAAAREEALLAAYDAAVAAVPALGPLLGPLRADHATHLAALDPERSATSTATAPAPGPPSSAPAAPPVPPAARAAALSRVVTAERAASREHALAALTAGRDLAGLLGSLAACEASHAAVLG